MRTVKVFVASSEELRQERLLLADVVWSVNNALETCSVEVELVKWEYFDSSLTKNRKQDEYNEELRKCDFCMTLFWNKCGVFTKEEMDTAKYHSKGLYVLFKEPADEISDKLLELKRAYDSILFTFESSDTLKLLFLLQLCLSIDKTDLISVKESKLLLNGNVIEEVKIENVLFLGDDSWNEKIDIARLIVEMSSIESTQKLKESAVCFFSGNILNMLSVLHDTDLEEKNLQNVYEYILLIRVIALIKEQGWMSTCISMFETGLKYVKECPDLFHKLLKEYELFIVSYASAKVNSL